jgi:type IV pilus assembly protein PilF
MLMNRSSTANRRHGSSRKLALFILVLLAIAGGGVGFYAWVGSAARRALYDEDQPERAAALLERWSPWLGSPKDWRWLLAESYRKAGDRGRVKRITDALAASGVEPIRASGPLLLYDASAGSPGRVKENLGPLLVAYQGQGSEVLAALVQGFTTQGDTTRATQTLRLWGELYDDDHQLELWRGIVATLKYDLPSAVAAFERSIELSPNYARARLELAEVFLEQARFEEARTQYEWLVNHTPEAPDLITGYARCLLNLGYADEAAEQLKKLPDISKLPSPELSLVCETNLEAGRVEEASQQAAILLNRWPDALPYLQLQARCLAKLGKQSESEALFAKAAISQTKRPDVDRMLEKLATDSANVQLRRDLGETMMLYLDPPGGVGFIQIASRANPGDLQSHQLLAMYYEREGKWSAAEVQRNAIRQIEAAQLQQLEMERALRDQAPSVPPSPIPPSPLQPAAGP